MIHVVNGSWVVAAAAHRNHVERTVRLTITTSMKSHSMGVSGGDWNGGHTAEPGECCFSVEPADVLSGSDE